MEDYTQEAEEEASTEDSIVEEEAFTVAKRKKVYECRACHVPLKGHKCPKKEKKKWNKKIRKN